METCQMCTSNSLLSFCDQRKQRICESCRSRHNSSSIENKEKKYGSCNQHGKAVNTYCCNCYTLTCITSVESHTGHEIISIQDAYESIKSDEKLFMNGLRTQESKLKCYEKNYVVVRNMIEEEEKRWLDVASSVKDYLYNELLDTDIRQAGTTLLLSLNEVQDQLGVLQAEECPFTFLSKWPSVISWLNEYNKVKQAVLDGQREQHDASCISQMFRRLILNHNGSPVDTPIDNDINMITEKMSGVSINENSDSEQSPNDDDDGFVHVDSGDVDCNRQFGNNKDEHACQQKLCKEQTIEIANLKKKLEQFGNSKDGHEKACHEQTIEITDLKKKLEQFGNHKDKHDCLQKTCHEQTIEITDLKKKLEGRKRPGSRQK